MALVDRVLALVTTKANRNNYQRLLLSLAQARIRGEVHNFRNAHGQLVKLLSPLLNDPAHFNDRFQAEEFEYKTRETIHLLEDLEAVLPGVGTDTAFFGYNEIDAKFVTWKAGSGDRRAKAKRKRAEKDGGDRGGAKKRGSVAERPNDGIFGR